MGSYTPGNGADIRPALERGLGLGLQHLLQVSRTKVPIEEGTLERSGKASQDGLRGAVSYSTPYAVIQHERMDFKHDNGREAKYLENAFNQEASTVGEIIATEVKKVLG